MKYYHTIKYLKWIQIKYQVWYRLKRSLWPTPSVSKKQLSASYTVDSNFSLLPSIPSNPSWLGNNKFKFLNITHTFQKEINWNYAANGKLWTYNLNYFEFLDQAEMSASEGLSLIHDFIEKEPSIIDGMESFPISLRLIFWIKFINKHSVRDTTIQASMYRQLSRLSRQPEFHLLGNHLLENACCLLIGGCYFKDARIIQQAKIILLDQLEEQILPDGAHFELSPMYHQILTYRLLDCLNVLQNNSNSSLDILLRSLVEKVTKMLGWMQEMTLANSDMACLNDSINGIAPAAKDILSYAARLQLYPQKITLKECGYRKIKTASYELLLDIGHIGPDYIPGHAHSDIFNFILYYNNKPFLVDTGISTYKKNKRRTLERSTCSHNTVTISHLNQSDVWGGFRVGKRANIEIIIEEPKKIIAHHDGYKKYGCHHQRTFYMEADHLEIIDEVSGREVATAHFHFHPDIDFRLTEQEIIGKSWRIQFKGLSSLQVVSYEMATFFNQTRTAKKIKVTFPVYLITTIQLP